MFDLIKHIAVKDTKQRMEEKKNINVIIRDDRRQ